MLCCVVCAVLCLRRTGYDSWARSQGERHPPRAGEIPRRHPAGRRRGRAHPVFAQGYRGGVARDKVRHDFCRFLPAFSLFFYLWNQNEGNFGENISPRVCADTVEIRFLPSRARRSRAPTSRMDGSTTQGPRLMNCGFNSGSVLTCAKRFP